MISIQTKTHIGPDGTLTVAVPTPLRETEVEVMLVVQPVSNGANGMSAAANSPTLEDLGWPPGFFEETFGSFRDDPLERLPQGDYEVREPLL